MLGNAMRSPITAGIVLSLLLIGLFGCKAKEPTQSVNFDGGMLTMVISQSWKPAWPEEDEETDASLFYEHAQHRDVRLSFENQFDEFGSPLQVPAVKSIIGKELNGRFGGVIARVSLGGNAMLKYPREIERDEEAYYTENWVLARPHGWGNIARVAVTLEVPAAQRQKPDIQELIATLDRQLGDAKLPES